jgi:hypothetical protein
LEMSKRSTATLPGPMTSGWNAFENAGGPCRASAAVAAVATITAPTTLRTIDRCRAQEVLFMVTPSPVAPVVGITRPVIRRFPA